MLSHETMKSLPMNIQGKLTMARPELNMKSMMRTVRTQLMRVPSSDSVPAESKHWSRILLPPLTHHSL